MKFRWARLKSWSGCLGTQLTVGRAASRPFRSIEVRSLELDADPFTCAQLGRGTKRRRVCEQGWL